jgi:hypothetical protein
MRMENQGVGGKVDRVQSSPFLPPQSSSWSRIFMNSDVRHVAGARVAMPCSGRLRGTRFRRALRDCAIVAAASGLFIVLPSVESVGLSAMGAPAPDATYLAANQRAVEEVRTLIQTKD